MYMGNYQSAHGTHVCELSTGNGHLSYLTHGLQIAFEWHTNSATTHLRFNKWLTESSIIIKFIN
jgi:hypothetical protein